MSYVLRERYVLICVTNILSFLTMYKIVKSNVLCCIIRGYEVIM